MRSLFIFGLLAAIATISVAADARPETESGAPSDDYTPMPLHYHNKEGDAVISESQEAEKDSKPESQAQDSHHHHHDQEHFFNTQDTSQHEHKHKDAKDIPIPDIETLREFIAQAKDYSDGPSGEDPFTSGIKKPYKSCKRTRAPKKGLPDNVEIVVAYPHPLSEEDKEKMASLSQAYWSAAGVEAPKRSQEEQVFFEKVVKETETVI